MIRKNKLFPGLFLVVSVLFLAACSPSATPTPAATAIQEDPTPTATTAPADTLPGAAEESTAEPSGAALTFTLVEGQSEARYRVREQLADRDLPNDAIGRTNQVSGAITLNPDGSIDTATSQFVVDVSTLATDQGMRDNFVRRNVLQTDQYPTVTFVPTAVSGLPLPLPTAGPLEFQLTGDLTIRDVTRPVTWTVTGTMENGQASGTATTTFTFDDFSIDQPQVPVVLSVDENITLELDLTIQN